MHHTVPVTVFLSAILGIGSAATVEKVSHTWVDALSQAEDSLDCKPEGLGLLQRDGVRRLAHAAGSSTHTPPATELFQEPEKPDRSLLPVTWLHIPKCGSSFLNALIKIPGACPNVPKDVVISDETMGIDNIKGFFDEYNPVIYCPWAFLTFGNHYGVGSRQNYERMYEGKGVTMLRNPEQRMISGYKNTQHSWPLDPGNLPPKNPQTYFDQLAGCMVRMLTRSGAAHPVPELGNLDMAGPHWGGPCGEGSPPTPDEVVEAKRRLNGFLFVGLQEEWELSMCLFHATFGGRCYPTEFQNSRHAEGQEPKKLYDQERWMGNYTDPYDDEIYAEGVKIFERRFRAQGLSEEACRPCFEQAGVVRS